MPRLLHCPNPQHPFRRLPRYPIRPLIRTVSWRLGFDWIECDGCTAGACMLYGGLTLGEVWRMVGEWDWEDGGEEVIFGAV